MTANAAATSEDALKSTFTLGRQKHQISGAGVFKMGEGQGGQLPLFTISTCF